MKRNKHSEKYDFNTPNFIGDIEYMLNHKSVYDEFVARLSMWYNAYGFTFTITENEDGQKVIDSNVNDDELERAMTNISMLTAGVSSIDWDNITSINKSYHKNMKIINKYNEINEERKYLERLSNNKTNALDRIFRED